MAKYTIELYKIHESDNVKIFDFDYELYDNECKPIFEKYFVEYFYFNEIGFETVGRFKKALQNKLNVIATKYHEIYRTVLVANEYDFMRTKNLVQRTIRELEGENSIISTNTLNSQTSTNSTNENIFSATPKGNISNLEHYMTEGTIDKNNATGSSVDNSNGKTDSENKQREVITIEEEGNLGAFSDAHLIERWRDIILDINEQICKKELKELFMLIY